MPAMLSASRSYADARAITTPLVAARRGEASGRNNADVRCESLKNLRDRITSVKNTKKITDAMKLVAAAKVRRAQNAVQNGRPFSENLVKVPAGARGEEQEALVCLGKQEAAEAAEPQTAPSRHAECSSEGAIRLCDVPPRP